MLESNRSLLNRVYILMNVLKALASIISMYSLHVIFLLKITLFTNGMPCLFIVRRESDCNLMRKVERIILSSLIFIFQRSHQAAIEFRPRCSFLRT
jgi:hypothetical protein